MIIKTIKKWLYAIEHYDKLLKSFNEVKGDIDKLMIINDNAYNEIKELEEELGKIKVEEELEEFWNNKRISQLVTWKARDRVRMDVKCFFQNDQTLPTFTGTNDEIAKKCLNYVINNVVYQLDTGEFWSYAYETLLRKVGDCEDMAILVANQMIMSGVPYFRIRLNTGFVKGGYHCWCTYLRESDNKWVVLDAAYWPRKCTGLKLLWKDAEKYFTIDSSWNKKYSYGGNIKLDK